MTRTAYCNRELCEMLDKAGIDAQHVIAFENESWYKKYTLDVAMRWLREEKKIAIQSFLLSQGWCCEIERIMEDFCKEYIEATSNYMTYEKAIEAAIKYCLENLINN